MNVSEVLSVVKVTRESAEQPVKPSAFYRELLRHNLSHLESCAENDQDAEQIVRCLRGALDACTRLVQAHEHDHADDCSACYDAQGISWSLDMMIQLMASDLVFFGNPVLDNLARQAADAGLVEADMPGPLTMVPISEDLADLARELSGGFPGTYLSNLLRPLLMPEEPDADEPLTVCGSV